MALRIIQQLKFFVAGLVLLSVAVLLPVYLRAVDSWAVQFAGAGTATLTEEAANQLALEKPGVADLLLKSAQQCGAAGWEEAMAAGEAFRQRHPDLAFWGGAFPELENAPVANHAQEATVVEAFINKPIRAAALRRLQNSRRPGVQTILQNRSLAHTEALPPVAAPGGAVLDTLIAALALLSQGDYLNAEFRFELERLASDANRGHSARDIEAVYLDLLSFAGRMNWAQFSVFMARIESRQTLHRLTQALAAAPEEELPVLFAAVWMSPSAAAVGDYLHRHPESGLEDLALGLAAHQGGIESILERQERVYRPSWLRRTLRGVLPLELQTFVAETALQLPWFSLLAKYVSVLLGAFSWIRFAFLAAPKGDLPPMMLRAEGVATLQQQILALLALILAVLLGEPFLAQNRQMEETPLHWKFPTAPAAVVEKVDAMLGSNVGSGSNVGETALLALSLFFLVQVVLYALSLAKLKEIKKQAGSSRLKIKLLDNEDNMFDAGLYVGLSGTVLSLVLLMLKLVQIGLMAAYSSTLFGIIFVSVLKIFHVRPYRRKLLIETEAGIL